MNIITYSILLGIIVVIGLIVSVGFIQVQHYEQTEEYCNNQYGINGWELNETTGTGVNKYSIGQVWECVPLSNSSSASQTSLNPDINLEAEE